MSVLTQVKITVALMPTALTPLEVMTAHVKLDILEMGTHVMVSLFFFRCCFYVADLAVMYMHTRMCGWRINVFCHYIKFADVDECYNDTYPCDSNANCTNNIGSFSCNCHTGYAGSGNTCEGKNIPYFCMDYT